MNPIFPIYIVSKGRHDSRLTARSLEEIRVPYYIIIEQQEYDLYAAVIDPQKILVLDTTYQDKYDTYDDLGTTKSKGPGPARNFAWDHSVKAGHLWHWVMDDNIKMFYRLHKNLKVPVADGTVLRCMEDFCLRYRNIAMAGPNYYMFCPRKTRVPPYVLNTRIYSCSLIRNDMPYRWRGRYNEDTDLSLRMLKDKWCTVQFNAFLQQKMPTQTVAGGNTKDFYEKEGTKAKSEMLVRMHPDVARTTWRFRRHHHHVDYASFKNNKLIRRPEADIPKKPNNYGMNLKIIPRTPILGSSVL